MTTHHKIAMDYYNSSLTNKEIGEKYNRHGSRIKAIVDTLDPEVWRIPKEDKVVIVLDRKDAEAASLILEDHMIKHHLPEEFALEERYPSSLNKR